MGTDMNRGSLLAVSACAWLCAMNTAVAGAKSPHEAPQISHAAEIAAQREALAHDTEGRGFGPQSPRDIDAKLGANPIIFSPAPRYPRMNLCNIHFHKNAEHKGGEFTRYAGDGDGHGYGTGYQYTGKLSARELAPIERGVCPGPHGALYPGDTIETHYVHSTAQVHPDPTLSACLSGGKVDNGVNNNPQLRVEAQVYVLVNDAAALDFKELTASAQYDGHYHALHIPDDTGAPVEYSGSTTGPGYNEHGSPFEVTWRVRPKVAKVNIHTLGAWCERNVYRERYAHGVRNLITNPALLAPIE